MSVELDADELALHEYQIEHFSEIMPFIFWRILGYGTLAGILLALIFYLWTYADTIQDPHFLNIVYNPPPPLPEVVLNCIVRVPIGALVGCTLAVGIGFIYAKLIQVTCRKTISTSYVEEYDLKTLFMGYQIFLPIPIVLFILIIETPVLWDADIRRGVGFILMSYVVISILLSIVKNHFLKWYIPPLLPPLE
ncbi:MAG: hypothetical protein H0X30_18280 [Anaerolineae bacterium]|nr:hypothetical protein [Anaerolineae bacterium]